MNKEQYVEAIEASRKLVASGRFRRCPCANVRCEWHGRCFECVLIHRVKRKHVPQCLQPILRDRIEDLARTAELGVIEARPGREMIDHLHRVSPPAARVRAVQRATARIRRRTPNRPA